MEEEIKEESDQSEESRERRSVQLEVLGKVVARIRNEAVSARRSSGFETQWNEDEEYYDGVDKYNPRILTDYTKPRSKDGVLTQNKESGETGSTAFINITAPFVDYASARMGDILLPANEWNFKIKPTPVPEFDKYEDDETLTNVTDMQGNQLTLGDVIKQRNSQVSSKVEKAETRIKDWLTECNYKAESRKVIENAAKVGVGILKGPYPDKEISTVFSDGVLQIVESIQPKSCCVDHWDFFPDMNCGENIQDGSYVIERDYLTARQLLRLRGVDGYMADQINKVIKEGPGKKYEYEDGQSADDERFEIWYCYVDIKPEEMAAIDEEYECDDDSPESVSAVVVLVNETVIKGYLNPLESGSYPYDVMVWRRVPGKPFGVGVARQGRKAQEMLNASVRALMDNMGLSAIPMLAIIRKALIPTDGNPNLCKGKVWELRESSGIDDINKAIQTLVIPSMQAELSANIELAMKFMEDITGITFLLQGQQGSAPDTVGGMNLLHQNASTVLRRCARIYDENITEPHIRRYHEYLLIDPDVPDEEKGDLQIEAVGSSHLVEREIQAMQLPQLLQLAMNPVFEKSPKKTIDEMLRALKFDPSKLDMDDEEKRQMAEAAQGQTAPQVQAAQIRAQTDLQKEQIRQEANVQKMQVDMDRDRVFAQGVTERNQMAYEKNIADMQLRIQEMEMKRELAMLDYANRTQQTLEQIKADLASDVMKLNLQKELAYNSAAREAEQVITPPAEPAGRAPDGYAFQR
ncbi:MAG: hypothetical protein H6937_02425 [Burkholderiales bacterium]|nr:hypothetical protein [Burkholderiales bacterium]